MTFCKCAHKIFPTTQIVFTIEDINSGVGISKSRKCCDLINAYLWLADRAFDAFTRSQHFTTLRDIHPRTPNIYNGQEKQKTVSCRVVVFIFKRVSPTQC